MLAFLCSLQRFLGFCLLTLIGVLQLSSTAAYASPCIDDGLAAYRHSGARAAYPVFRQRLEDPACVRSIILLLNYARVIEEIVDENGDDPKTCEAVEVYTQVSLHQQSSASIRKLGQRGVNKLEARCVSYIKQQSSDDYYRIISRADSLRGASRLRAAALDYKTAYRLNPKRREAPLALCEILPRIKRTSEAEPFCRPSDSIQPAVESASLGENIVDAEVAPPQSSTTGWIIVSSAALAFVAGGIVHGFAHSEADDAWTAREAGLAAQERGEATAIEAAINRISDGNDRAKGLEITAWSLYSVGALLGGIGLYKLLSTSSATPDGFTLSPGGVVYSAGW